MKAAAPPVQELVRVLQAMSDPHRLKMLKLLADGEWHPCGPEVWATGLHKSTISHHMRILREAGLVENQQHGRSKHAKLRRDAIEERFPGLLGGILPNL
ncbi:ArsR/SmtB family transcription factor [Plantactinospora sp. WMMB334]|uniref:ArsR/SmtB family transcription factor n=1 Tax=Plantactinospora sp. WMMB334 TaxID=3404119 RepID=UPI003B957997